MKAANHWIANTSGQTLIEFLIGMPLLIAAILASVMLFKTEWNKVQCARSAFKSAHRALRGDETPVGDLLTSARVTIEKTPSGVIAHAICGDAHEDVALPELEKAQW